MANQSPLHNNNNNKMANQNSLSPTHHKDQVVVVMVPFPAQGHLNQLLHLSRLILPYNIPIHYVGTAVHNRQAKLRVHGWDPLFAPNIHFHDFETPHFPSPVPNPKSKTKFPSHLQPAFNASSAHLRRPVSHLLRNLSSQARKVIVINDSLMGSVVQEVRYISNAESYTFHSVSAFAIYLFAREQILKQMDHNSNGLDIPSLEDCFTIEFLDFVSAQYPYRKFHSGYIYNTCKLIEGTYLDLFNKESMEEGKKHWGLGPFNPVTVQKSSKNKHFCLDWLDKQANDSVIFVSFGTTTALDDDQIQELAAGLKQSNQKFIWVLRDADIGDVFSQENGRRVQLPKGYEDSVAEVGLVVRDWAPQLEILAHPATGGFMSHCGWNSCMESISMGVPIAAWPMHSDQPRNTVLVTRLLKVGIVVKDWARRDEVVNAKIVESAVKKLMGSKEGDEVRKRADQLGNLVRESMGEGGVSRTEMDSFIAHITS